MMRSRDLGWTLGAPVRTVLFGAIRLYRATLSKWFGGQCRFHPSCSRYAEDAIRIHGAVKGTGLATWRILRCNPFGRGGLDPVPARRAPRVSYDSVIRNPTSRAVGDRDAG